VTEGASSGGVSREQVDALYARIAELDGEVARLQAILRQAGDIIITTDLDGRVIDFNEEAEHVLGYRAADVLGKPAESFYHRKRQRRKLIEQLEQAPSRALEDELRRLSITDELTGLYNQSHFFHRLEVEKERAIRLDHELALVLFDLDGFKQLNDTQGHRFGDEVLRQIGSVLFRSVRKGVDSAFRYGGDEFTVLLPGAAPETSVAFAERLRTTIEGLELGVRASMGLCAFDRARRSLPIVERADAAMYLAKRQGGNRVARYDPSAEAPLLVEA
jgi:diguanylate cyclase (GGDEF)-like protein